MKPSKPSRKNSSTRSVPVHPDVVKAAALAAYDTMGTRDDYAIRRAAEVCHIPEGTIRSWLRRDRQLNKDAMHMRTVKRADIADRLEDMVHRIIDQVPESLPTAPLNQLAVAMGIAIDKRLILLGQPNSIGVSVNLSPEQRARRLDEIFSRHSSDKAQEGNEPDST